MEYVYYKGDMEEEDGTKKNFETAAYEFFFKVDTDESSPSDYFSKVDTDESSPSLASDLEETVEMEDDERDLEVGNSKDNTEEIFKDKVAAHIKAMESKLHFFQLHQNYDKFQWASIYKVPEKLRKVNEDAYIPRVLSIGPYHHSNPRLQAMVPYKWRCLDRYLQRTGFTSLHSIAGNSMLQYQFLARNKYQDSFEHINCEEFSEMIMLDCIFIVELILENVSEVSMDNVERPTTKIFDDPWIKHDILHDLILLENQLPYEIMETFFRDNNIKIPIDLAHKYVCKYFKSAGMISRFLPIDINERPAHLVDFLAKSHIPKIRNELSSRKGKLELSRTVTKLQEAGVKFVSITGSSLLDVQFDSTRGVLKIPQLIVSENTETLFRNLIAFEQCRRHTIQCITSYIILMDSLIDTPKDVELLVSCGIIKNSLENSERVSNLFNNLPKETIVDNTDFYFAVVCEDLNKYSKNWYTQWKASWFRSRRILRRDYLSNTWTTISVIAASILLILTVIQTVCSVLQL